MEISIIVPIYNVEKYIFKCLESIVNQSFTDFEVILVDDGSTDNSSIICNKFVTEDSRFKYFYKNNGGLSDARNYGLNYAKGKYVVFIDSDDFIEKKYLEILYKEIKGTCSDICICSFYTVDSQGNKLRTIGVSDNESVTGKELIRNHFKKGGNVADIVAWNKIYLRKIFNTIRYPYGRYFEDEFIFVPLFWQAKRVTCINIPLYDYVQRKGSIIQTKFSKKKLEDNLTFRKERMHFFKNRDAELYKISIQDFKNYIIDLMRNNEITLTRNEMLELQIIYRNLVRLVTAKKLKLKVKDAVGFFNLNLFNLKRKRI